MSGQLEKLLAEIRACRHCRELPRPQRLPHEPRPVLRAKSSARLGIFSQAPGTKVHASGVPFTDASGDRLRQWLGIGPEQFYDEAWVAIVPMGFCFPGTDANGGDLPPRPECAPRWRARVMAELPNLELGLLIGQYAQRWHLGDGARGGVTETVASWREHYERKGRPRVLPLPHPSWRNTAWLKKHPWFEAELLPVVRNEVTRLLKPPSGRGV